MMVINSVKGFVAICDPSPLSFLAHMPTGALMDMAWGVGLVSLMLMLSLWTANAQLGEFVQLKPPLPGNYGGD